MTCQNCGKKGHNKAGCTNTKVDKPPKSPRTKGRPKKNRDVESTSLVDEPDVAMNVTGGFATFEVGGSSATSSTTKRGGKRVKFNTNVQTSQRLHSDTIEAQPTTQRSQTTRMQSNIPAAVQVTPTTSFVQVNPIGAAGSFVRPRGKSERIVKNKLLKKNPCVGSSKSNVENLE
ncbi:pentatricopeptide repeat-containing protein [Tanacetum coccineum]